MTILETRSTADATTVTWTSPDTDLWVATIDGEYFGMIEFVGGHFVTSDATGVVLSSASSIPAAKALLFA